MCVKAIGHTIQNGPHDCIDEFRTALSQKTMDHNPTVRKSLYTVRARNAAAFLPRTGLRTCLPCGALGRRAALRPPFVPQVAGRWMIELRDRYSFWHKLLPILLSGETDEVEEIRDLARESFWKVRVVPLGHPFVAVNRDASLDRVAFPPLRLSMFPRPAGSLRLRMRSG